MAEPCGLVGNIAGVEISAGFDLFKGWADESYKATQDTLDELSEFIGKSLQPVPLTVEFIVPKGLGDPFTRPYRPEAPDTEFAPVSVPEAPTVQTITAPAVTDPPVDDLRAPAIVEPPRPEPIIVSYPPAPVVEDVPVPPAPVLDYPEVPVLREIVLPPVPVLDLPVFTATPPPVTFDPPPNVIDDSWNEPYVPVLAEDLQAVIEDMLQGSVGIPQAVWDQIWDTAAHKADQAGQREVEQAAEEWASRGFELPPGVVNLRIAEARQNAANINAEQVRAQVIEQSRTELENLRVAIAQGIAKSAI